MLYKLSYVMDPNSDEGYVAYTFQKNIFTKCIVNATILTSQKVAKKYYVD